MAVALSALLAGCEKKEEAAAAPPPTPEVLVAEVREEMLPKSREWVSTLDGSTNAVVKARVQGYLETQDYTNGSVVKTGDTLFTIDPRPFEAALGQAKSNLLRAEAAQVQAGLNEQRQVQLLASNSVSVADRDLAVQQNAAAKAEVLAMKAAVAQADLNLSFTKILAPVDGIAGIAVPGIGDLVGPSTGELCSISTVDPIKAIFQLSEQEYMAAAEALDLSSSAPATFEHVKLQLILGNGKPYPLFGRLSVLGREIDPRTGTIEIQGLFPNPRNVLRPGFFARVRVMSEPVPTLLIPQRAVVEVQGSYQVFVVGSDGKAAVRQVKVGNRFGSDWEITSGLKKGERVVAEGIQTLRDGMTVAAKPFTGDSETTGAAEKKTPGPNTAEKSEKQASDKKHETR